MAAPEMSGKLGAPGRWSLHGKTALVTGGTRGIGYPSTTSFSSLATPVTLRLRPRDPLDGELEELM
jgi:Tropinone reductase 1